MRQTVCWIDLETGGLDLVHPTIQVAAVAVREWQVLEEYEAKIQFREIDADPETLILNSYDRDLWEKEAKDEADVVAELGMFLRRHAAVQMISQRGRPYRIARLAGHNITGFDAPRLIDMFRRYDSFYPAAYHCLDTVQLALWRAATKGEAPPSFKLGDLCAHYGVELAADRAHDALVDVRATIGLARALLEERL